MYPKGRIDEHLLIYLTLLSFIVVNGNIKNLNCLPHEEKFYSSIFWEDAIFFNVQCLCICLCSNFTSVKLTYSMPVPWKATRRGLRQSPLVAYTRNVPSLYIVQYVQFGQLGGGGRMDKRSEQFLPGRVVSVQLWKGRQAWWFFFPVCVCVCV